MHCGGVHFAEVSVGVMVACTLALGFAIGVPILLSWSDVYEVPISCGYMLTMLALAAVWCALHQPEWRGRWLATASVAYGLAVGARPSLLFGAVILLIPVFEAWRKPRPRKLAGLLAAMIPITLIGLGLMLYNRLRFDNPFDFGEHYQIAGERQFTRQFFNLRYLWFNFRVYFLEPAHWSLHSPFIHGIAVPPLPENYGQVRNPFGVLTSIPVVWLALAAPLACRNRLGPVGSLLRWFVMTVALLFGSCALTRELFGGASLRYEVDFLPALVLLAVIGILGVERALAPTSKSGQADRPARRWAARCGWGLLLVFSVVFNLFATVQYYAEAQYDTGIALGQAGRLPEAVEHFEQALRIWPDFAEVHNGLAAALMQLGRRQEAMEHWEQTLRIKPNNAAAHNSLGNVLLQEGRLNDAIAHFEQALRIRPDFAEAHCNLGIALGQTGRRPEAIDQLEQALRIKPGYAAARNALTRLQAGSVSVRP